MKLFKGFNESLAKAQKETLPVPTLTQIRAANLQLEEPSKADNVITNQADKMRDLRLHIVATLEGYLERDEISPWEAVQYFAKATLMERAKAAQYLQTFASDGSLLKTYSEDVLKAVRTKAKKQESQGQNG